MRPCSSTCGLQGNAGNDNYVIGNSRTSIIELAGQGTADRVTTSVSFVLASDDNIEIVSTNAAAGLQVINLTGNQLAQTMFGNAAANALDGRGGSDALTGNGGADRFVFSTTPSAGNVDRITDFQTGQDKIWLSDSVYTALSSGNLALGAFRISLSGTAADSTDRIIYEFDTGRLYYDADGAGGATAVNFAQLEEGLALKNTDFWTY